MLGRLVETLRRSLSTRWRRAALPALGLLSLLPYLYALRLQDLRQNTPGFEVAFFSAFALYAVAVVTVLTWRGSAAGGQVALIFAFAVLFRAILLFTPPTLSDDMYRYVWDGRVQAHGISPYAYPPLAPALAGLRDGAVWSHINRINDVTVYPAGAELAYAALWRVVPDSVRWFQIAMAAGDLLAGALLALLLRAFGKPERLALIYLWSPLVIFETAHSAHVDGLVLPLLVGAWLARVRGRDGWTGALLGAATALKLYPILLLPALWRARDDRGRLRPAWQMPISFAAVLVAAYLPYLAQGARVLGFLPNYFDERFNMGLAGQVLQLAEKPPNDLIAAAVHLVGGDPSRVVSAVMAAALALIGLAFVLRPAADARQAVGRSIWLIGAFTLLAQNLFAWYMLWSVPLLALFLQPGRFGLRLDAWTGWFLFSGTVALSYTFFVKWVPVTWAAPLEFGPLYALLVIPAVANAARYAARFRSRPLSDLKPAT